MDGVPARIGKKLFAEAGEVAVDEGDGAAVGVYYPPPRFFSRSSGRRGVEVMVSEKKKSFFLSLLNPYLSLSPPYILYY